MSERDQAFEVIREQKQEIEKLRNKLLFYENPHAPPSVTTLKGTDTESNIDSIPKKRGAPKGHRGATRPTPVPDDTKDVIAEHCEKCGSPDLKVLNSVEKTVIEDMLPPQKIKTIQYNRWKVECLQCGHIFTSKDPNCPQKAIFKKNLEHIVDKFAGFDKLKKPVTYIKNGLGRWYTCMLYPGMEPTNNLGEQAMREHVILRKIIRCFRSENGAEKYQYIASLLADWRLQRKNGFEELEQLLRRELCMG